MYCWELKDLESSHYVCKRITKDNCNHRSKFRNVHRYFGEKRNAEDKTNERQRKCDWEAKNGERELPSDNAKERRTKRAEKSAALVKDLDGRLGMRLEHEDLPSERMHRYVDAVYATRGGGAVWRHRRWRGLHPTPTRVAHRAGRRRRRRVRLERRARAGTRRRTELASEAALQIERFHRARLHVRHEQLELLLRVALCQQLAVRERRRGTGTGTALVVDADGARREERSVARGRHTVARRLLRAVEVQEAAELVDATVNQFALATVVCLVEQCKRNGRRLQRSACPRPHRRH